MRRAAILQAHAEEIRLLTRRHRAANARVFGSTLRGQDGDTSDIDIVVDALPGATLFDLGALQMDLQELLGEPVDLLTPRDIASAIRSRVLAEARPI